MPKKVVTSSAPEELLNAKREARRAWSDRQKKIKRNVRLKNKRLLGELADMRARVAPHETPPRSTEQMLDDLRHRAYAMWRFAAAEVDRLHPDDFWAKRYDAQGNIIVEPHRWIQYEAACRAELEELGIKLIGLGLEERRVRLEEAQHDVVLHWFDGILGALNLTETQLDALPGALDAAAPILEGRAHELKPARPESDDDEEDDEA